MRIAAVTLLTVIALMAWSLIGVEPKQDHEEVLSLSRGDTAYPGAGVDRLIEAADREVVPDVIFADTEPEKQAPSDATASLTGAVVDSEGRPVPCLQLRAQHVAAGLTKGYMIRLSDEALAALAPGVAEAKAVTDQDGRFAFEGLAAGSYYVWTKASLWEHWSVYKAQVTAEPVEAGPAAVTLVHEGAFLLVALQSVEGTPWEGRTHATAWNYERHADATWPSRVRVRLTPAVLVGREWVVEQADIPDLVMGFRSSQGMVRFHVDPSRTYLLYAVGMNDAREGFAGTPRRISFTDGESRSVVVRASKLPSFGRVEVTATVETASTVSFPFDGGYTLLGEGPKRSKKKPYVAGHDPSHLQVEHAISGVVLLQAPGNGTSPYHFDVPPGEYRVVARADTSRSSFSIPTHGGASSLVTATSDQVARVHLDVGAGGRIAVVVAERDDGARLERVDGAGRTTALLWSKYNGTGQTTNSSWWGSDQARTSDPIPAGTYRIVGQRGFPSGGGWRYDIPVTIEDGKTVTIHVD